MLDVKKIYLQSKNRSLKLVQRLAGDSDGVVAIEFAILAIPFFMLLFGILELAIIFFMSTSLQAATVEAGRLIRTGQFNDLLSSVDTSECSNADYSTDDDGEPVSQADQDAKTAACVADLEGGLFVDSVCTIMNPGGNIDACVGRTSVNVTLLDDFKSTVTAGSGDDDDEDEFKNEFTESAGGDTIYISVEYRHQLTLPGEWTRLATDTDDNVRELRSITAFRNEPF